MKIEIGDKLTRMLGGTLPMEVIVGSITEDTFRVGSADGKITHDEGWIFCSRTGYEIDHRLKWGPQYGTSGSFIKEIK